nr:MAG TPA: hypothetical protein [Caudoviricetes sp.]DAM71178.1 MAG TPA: hypothetical protein [Caudoviricetes sp.]
MHIGFSPMIDSSSLARVLARCTIFGGCLFRVGHQ